MKSVKIKIKLLPNGIMPKKATEDSVCYDVFASEILINNTRDKATVYLGFATEIPKGWKGVLVPRSSQNKTYWTMLNVPGQIDSDFRGEWQLRLTSIPKSKDESSQPFTIDYTSEIFPFKVGDRVAQIYFEEVTDVEFEQVEELSNTQRGEGGFGSTGKTDEDLNLKKEYIDICKVGFEGTFEDFLKYIEEQKPEIKNTEDDLPY